MTNLRHIELEEHCAHHPMLLCFVLVVIDVVVAVGSRIVSFGERWLRFRYSIQWKWEQSLDSTRCQLSIDHDSGWREAGNRQSWVS